MTDKQLSALVLNCTLSPSPAGAPRPYQSGEIQAVQSASTGTWGWTAEVPDLVSGSVFGLFTYRADHFRDPWIEFDFEFRSNSYFASITRPL